MASRWQSTLGTAGKVVGTIACLVFLEAHQKSLSFSVSPCSLLSTRSALQKVSSLICCEFPLEFLNFFLNFYLWGVCACMCPCVSMSMFACLCPSIWCVCVYVQLCSGTRVCGGQRLTSAIFAVLHLMFLKQDFVRELAVSARRADKHLPGSACLSASSPY